jgi:enediyne biosynthesis protein E5
MIGVAFVLFSFYMISDPATTPFGVRSQVVFGASVAAVYGILVVMHVVFGLFFALSAVTCARALAHWVRRPASLPSRVRSTKQVPEPASVMRKPA